MKKTLFGVGLCLSLIAVAMIFNVRFQNMPSEPSKQHNGKLSKEAFWSGGVDGGNWFVIKKKSKKKFLIEVYFDWDFELRDSGIFMSKNDYEISELKALIGFYDGAGTIYLRNKDVLKKI